MKSALSSALLALIAGAVLTSCATVHHGPAQRIAVDTEPRGATVTPVRCGAIAKPAKTPGEIWVSRRSTRCRFEFDLDGHYSEKVFLTRAVAPVAAVSYQVDPCGDSCRTPAEFLVGLAGSLLFSASSVAIDAASGARWEQRPSAMVVPLQRKE